MAYAATQHTMAYSGAAAYDIYRQTGAVKRPRQTQLPQDRPRTRTKAQPQNSLVMVAELLAAAVVLLLIIFSYMKFYEVSSQTTTLKSQLAQLQEEQVLLRSQYDSSVDLAAIEDYAISQLGMSRPVGGQTVHVNLSGTDRAEVLSCSGGGVFSGAAKLFKDAFSNLGEYLS